MNPLEQIQSKLSEITKGFDPKISDLLMSNKHWIVMLQTDQLNAGISSKGEKLSPSYLQDPYFKTQQGAISYMNKKSKLYAPQYFKIYPEKDEQTPNLIVSGVMFHNYINADINGLKIRLNADSSPINSNIMSKYGDILGLAPYSIDFLYKNYIEKELFDWIKSVSL